MKIAIVTLYTDEIADYGEFGARNKKAYADRHGYDFFVYRNSVDPARHPAWSKLPAITRHLSDYDWLFWTDADSLVMNPFWTLESIIQGYEQKDMILTWEAGAAGLNDGEWLIRNSPWSAATLAAIADPAHPNPRPDWFEQGALISKLEAEPSEQKRIAILHPRVMNSTPRESFYPGVRTRESRYRRGDFIIHFWPLARRHGAVHEMMTRYNALTIPKRIGPADRLRRMFHKRARRFSSIRP